MRILYGSDLHLEFGRGHPPIPSGDAFDVVVLGGDINTGDGGVRWAAERFHGKPIVYVPGNHEYYGFDFDLNNAAMATLGDVEGLHVLLPGAVTIDGVRFIGATLWSDLHDPETPPERQYGYERHIERGINDFRLIGRGTRRWTAKDHRATFAEHRAFLDQELSAAGDMTSVVVTHFLPTRQAIASKYAGSAVNGYFASDLDDLMVAHQPTAWIFGHTHDAQAFTHVPSGVALVANPFGYPGENPDKGWKVLEIAE